MESDAIAGLGWSARGARTCKHRKVARGVGRADERTHFQRERAGSRKRSRLCIRPLSRDAEPTWRVNEPSGPRFCSAPLRPG